MERDLSWLTPDIELVQAMHRARFAALYAGHSLPHVISIAGKLYGRSHGLHGSNEIDMLAQPAAWLDDVLDDMAANAPAVAADPITFRPLVIHLDPLGVHFIDALLGANVYFHEGQVWVSELPGDIADLRLPDLACSTVMQQAIRLAEMAVEVGQGRLLIGMPVLSCAINIGINVFGQRLLEALVFSPDVAHHALGVINDVIVACMRTFCEVIPAQVRRTSVATSRYAPPGYGLIDGCATHVVSKKHYGEFFAPLDEAVLSTFPYGGMIHLCGAHAQHIATWKAMGAVRSLQLNDRAVDDLERYVAGLRPDQLLYVGPTETWPVQRIMDVTQGRRLALQCVLEKAIAVGR